MRTRRQPEVARLSAAVLVSFATLLGVAFAPACGGGDITFGGDDDDSPTKVTVTGNLDSVTPVTTRDIVAFVYKIDDGSDRCPCPANPSNNSVGKAVVIPDGQGEFTISDLEPGKLGVVFLLDNADDTADGEIDPGDPIAVLDDPDCQLDDVDGKITVTLEDIDINFQDSPLSTSTTLPSDDCRDGNPPTPGRARADLIRKQLTVTPN